MTPKKTSKQSNDEELYTYIKHKRNKRKSKIKVGLVRASNLRNIFYERDITKWNCELYTISKVIDHAVPSYYLEPFPETYEDVLLK